MCRARLAGGMQGLRVSGRRQKQQSCASHSGWTELSGFVVLQRLTPESARTFTVPCCRIRRIERTRNVWSHCGACHTPV
jgi:hypothetical protein